MENSAYTCVNDQTADCMKVVFSGRMDTEFINREMDNILQKTNRCEQNVVIDLGNVDYVSSSFLRLCVSIAKAENMNRHSLSVTGLSPTIKKVFKIAGLDTMIT